MKAFDVLERFDSAPEYWEGKRGACIGVFQQVIAGEDFNEGLTEVMAEIMGMLTNSSNQQAEYIARVINGWQEENETVIENS